MKERKLRFLHTADIHLGSIPHINTDYSKEFKDFINMAIYSAFNKIVQYAIEYKVDFIIIAGDLYDSEFRSVESRKTFYEGSLLLKENNIDIYLARGNHDAFGGEKSLFKLPSNVHQFRSDIAEGFEIIKNDVLVGKVIGQSYRGKWERRKLHQNYGDLAESEFNIGVLHTGLEGNNPNYAPCTISELKEVQNINYWALGHIHKKDVIIQDKTIVTYPGIPQGRDMNEEGIGGCYLIDVDSNNNMEYKFLETSMIEWKKVNVDLSNYKLENINDLEDIMIDIGETVLLNSDIKGYAIRWIIKGHTLLNSVLREDEENSTAYLLKNLNLYFLEKKPFIVSDSIIIKTLDEIEELDIKLENNEIFNELQSIFNKLNTEEEYREMIFNNLGNIFEKETDLENLNKEKFQLHNEFMEDIIGEAKNLIYKKLLQEGDFIEDK